MSHALSSWRLFGRIVGFLNQTWIAQVTLDAERRTAAYTEDDREATVRRLQEAFAEGHISHAEMDDHLRAVLTAEIYKTPPRLGGPRIRISGTMEYGRLKIRHKAPQGTLTPTASGSSLVVSTP